MQATDGNEKGRRPGKTPTPMQATGDCAPVKTNVQTTCPRAAQLTPRHQRLLLALLRGPQTREDVDRIVGASNGPDEVLRLRRRFGLDIPCVRRKGFDRDQHSVEFGIYSLTSADAQCATALLREATP